MNINLSPYAMVRDLNASYKQIVEIARALMFQAKVIIMDEPTTALTNVEIEHVFRLMKDLREKGISFIFISHKLNEVTQICDSYTIMRDGVVVDSGMVTPDVTEEYLARQMVGRTLNYDDLYKKRDIGEEILRTEHLTKEREYEDVNISVKKGEIIGITGLLGDGRYEVANSIYGNNSGYSGKIFIHGRETKMSTIQKSRHEKISYLPRNRKENGIIKDLDIRENITISILGQLRKAGIFIHHRKEAEIVEQYIEELNIRLGNMKDNIRSLSGGNQQKVILARTLSSNPELIILDNPTQGVDVGAKLEIYRIIYKLAEKGVSFLVLSGEAQEVLRLCDRIYVMYHGEVRTELNRDEADEEKIMIAATGGKV
jgi:ribose transport system ATP-binding protein